MSGIDKRPAKLSEVEAIKQASDRLRGTLAQSLRDPLTGALAPADTHIVKFHGIYQQDDRDLRNERQAQKLEPAWQFMIRVRLPGGVCSPEQWLAMDALADRFGDGGLRLTTRQTFQLHGVLKGDLKATVAAMHGVLLDSIATCGDVNRNVICSPLPERSAVHRAACEWSRRLSEHLLPRTRAYHEIWLDGERVAGGEEREPLYGETYLPRKFKIAVAIPPHNDVDVFANDLGFIAIADGDRLTGFNVCVGGGMGMSHGETATYPRLADVIGFCTPEQFLEVAEQVVAVQRDFGDRADRKHARLKYTIEDRGLPWFVEELERRLGYGLAPPQAYAFTSNQDRFGWMQDDAGRWHLTLHVLSGRIRDREDRRLKRALAAIARVHRGEFRITPNQNLIIADVSAPEVVDTILADHGVAPASGGLRRNAMSCVALPTCPLAMAESERYLPTLLAELEPVLQRLGLAEDPITLRMTGCPNGCARPYLAEIALVGKGPGLYQLYLGGNAQGDRLAELYGPPVRDDEIVSVLEPILRDYAERRRAGEGFGDFLLRAGYLSGRCGPERFHAPAPASVKQPT